MSRKKRDLEKILKNLDDWNKKTDAYLKKMYKKKGNFNKTLEKFETDIVERVETLVKSAKKGSILTKKIKQVIGKKEI